jgi:hypothetical protein
VFAKDSKFFNFTELWKKENKCTQDPSCQIFILIIQKTIRVDA